MPLYEAQRTVDGITAKLWLSMNRRDSCREGLPGLNRSLAFRVGAGGLGLFASAPPATPHPRRSEAEAFQNSRRHGLTTTVLWSVPAFLPASASVGPRSFGKVHSEPRQAHLKITVVTHFFSTFLKTAQQLPQLLEVFAAE